MVLEDYTLKEISDRVREEFGLEDITAVTDIITKRINDAQYWIVRRRPNWPWMQKRLVLDVSAAVAITAIMTQGSRTLTAPVAIRPAIRKVVTREESGSRPTTGFLVVADADPDVTLDQQYLGATDLAPVAMRVVTGYFQMPTDFIRLDGPPVLRESTTTTQLHYRDPNSLNVIRNSQIPALLNDRFYSVEDDPLDAEDNKYLSLYPYYADINVIHINYWRDVPKLVANGDIPIVPRSNRAVMQYAAMWFCAQWQDELEKVTLYRDLALLELDRMAQEFEFADDLTANEEVIAEPDFVLPPSGFEDFDRG